MQPVMVQPQCRQFWLRTQAVCAYALQLDNKSYKICRGKEIDIEQRSNTQVCNDGKPCYTVGQITRSQIMRRSVSYNKCAGSRQIPHRDNALKVLIVQHVIRRRPTPTDALLQYRDHTRTE